MGLSISKRRTYRIEILRVGARRRRIDAALIRRAVRATLRAANRQTAAIGIALMDDDSIAALNETYLGHTGPTDVITFPLEVEAAKHGLEGDLAVSVETAAREAAKRGHSLHSEVLLYVVHGVLHLLGHDDKTLRGAASMRKVEDRILRSLGCAGVFTRKWRGVSGDARGEP